MRLALRVVVRHVIVVLKNRFDGYRVVLRARVWGEPRGRQGDDIGFGILRCDVRMRVGTTKSFGEKSILSARCGTARDIALRRCFGRRGWGC